MHFDKIRKQDAWEELGKEMNRLIDECKKKMENLTVISLMGENEDEEKQWDRRKWVLLVEIFMYSGNAYILSWDETTAFYTSLGTLITCDWKTIRYMKVSAHFLKKTHFCPIIFTNIYSFLKPRLHVMTWPYKISLLIKKFTFLYSKRWSV